MNKVNFLQAVEANRTKKVRRVNVYTIQTTRWLNPGEMHSFNWSVEDILSSDWVVEEPPKVITKEIVIKHIEQVSGKTYAVPFRLVKDSKSLLEILPAGSKWKMTLEEIKE